MIKGLGHLIRTMFGGKQPSAALPSHMVGVVEGEMVHAPLASDDVLRRAMEAAADSGDPAASDTARADQYRMPRAEDVGSLPTLFLHGRAAAQEPHAQELDAETLLTSPEFAVAPVVPVAHDVPLEVDYGDVGDESASSEHAVTTDASEATRLPRLETLVSFQEIIQAPRASLHLLQVAIAGGHAGRVVGQVDPSGAEPAAGTSQRKAPARKMAEPGAAPRRKKAAKPLPEDAVWLTDAVIWTQCGSWREYWLPPTDPESSARVEAFRLLAAEGQLTIWGRTGDETEWTPIATSHWTKAGFDPLAFLAGRENAFSQAPVKKNRTKPPADPVRYASLQVSRASIEALWAARDSQQVAVA